MLAHFVELAGDRLINAPFDELLGTDLADSDRFRRVETKIKRHERTLRTIDSGPPVGVVTARRVRPRRKVDKPRS